MEPDDLYWAQQELERAEHSTPFGRDVSRARLWTTGPYLEEDKPTQERERKGEEGRE